MDKKSGLVALVALIVGIMMITMYVNRPADQGPKEEIEPEEGPETMTFFPSGGSRAQAMVNTGENEIVLGQISSGYSGVEEARAKFVQGGVSPQILHPLAAEDDSPFNDLCSLDFNGDGTMDWAVITSNQKVRVGNGDTKSIETSFDLDGTLIASSDIGSDGYDDLLVLDQEGNIQVITNDAGALNKGGSFDTGIEGGTFIDSVEGDGVTYIAVGGETGTGVYELDRGLNPVFRFQTTIKPLDGTLIHDEGELILAYCDGSDTLWVKSRERSSGLDCDDNTKSVDSGDVNNDGHPDIVCMSYGTGMGYMYTLNGETIGNVDMGRTPMHIVIADLDGMAGEDIVSVNYVEGGIGVRLNGPDGIGELERFTMGQGPAKAIIGDLDGDGDPDVATGMTGADTGNMLAIAHNNGLGEISPLEYVRVVDLPRAVEMGHLDDDGRIDILCSGFGSDAVSILYNKADGFERQDIATGGQPRGVFIADLNGNGINDVAAADFWTYTVSVAYDPGENRDKTEADAAFSTGKGPRGLGGGDLDNDGDIDLVTADSGGSSFSILWNEAGGFNTVTYPEVGKSPRGVYVNDIDGDGWNDVVLTIYKENSIMVFYNQNGSFDNQTYEKVEGGQRPRNVWGGDLDNDGDIDLAASSCADGTVTTFRNDDGVPVRWKDIEAGGEPHCVKMGDFDGNGKLDIACANEADNTVTVVHDAGYEHTVETRPSGFTPRWLAIGDLNGDGNPDIAVAAYAQNMLVIDHYTGSYDASILTEDGEEVTITNDAMDLSQAIYVKDSKVYLKLKANKGGVVEIRDLKLRFNK